IDAWNKYGSWVTTPICAMSSFCFNVRTSSPPYNTVPELASYKRGMRLPMVVLPEPDAPTKATNCPGAISKDTPSRVGRDSDDASSYWKLTLSNWTWPARPGRSDGDFASGASTTAG